MGNFYGTASPTRPRRSARPIGAAPKNRSQLS